LNSKYPNIKQSIFLILGITGIMIGLGIFLGILAAALKLKISNHPVIIGSINLFAIGFFLLRAKSKTKCKYAEIYPIQPFDKQFLIPMVLILLGLSVILSEMDNVLRIFLPMPDFLMKIFMGLTLKSENLFESIFLLSIIAPVSEELLFRGLILQSFLNQYNVWKSVLVSSFLFALMHLNPWQFTSAFLLGIVFSFWFIKFKSLLPCLIGHSLFNSLPILLKYTNLNIAGYTTDPVTSTFQPIWFDAVGFTLLGFGIYIFKKLSSGLNKPVFGNVE